MGGDGRPVSQLLGDAGGLLGGGHLPRDQEPKETLWDGLPPSLGSWKLLLALRYRQAPESDTLTPSRMGSGLRTRPRYKIHRVDTEEVRTSSGSRREVSHSIPLMPRMPPRACIGNGHIPSRVRMLLMQDHAFEETPDTPLAHHVDCGVAEGNRAILRLDGLHSFLDTMQTDWKKSGGIDRARSSRAQAGVSLLVLGGSVPPTGCGGPENTIGQRRFRKT